MRSIARFLRQWRRWWRDALWHVTSLAVLAVLATCGAFPSFTVFEAGWVWVALTGVPDAAKNMASELAGRRVTRARGLNGGRMIVLNGAVRQSRLILFGIVNCLALGIFAATPPERRTWLSWLPAVQLMLLVGALRLMVYLSKLQRESLLDVVRAMDGDRPHLGLHGGGGDP